MAAARRPTDEDHREAIRLALSVLASGQDPDALVEALEPLHPKNNTFPAEVLLGLAADALVLGGVSREAPIEYDGLRERFLPEWEVRGKSAQHRSHYALRAVPMIVAGVMPDLLDEMAWQQSDDWWVWSVYVWWFTCGAPPTTVAGEWSTWSASWRSITASISARRRSH